MCPRGSAHYPCGSRWPSPLSRYGGRPAPYRRTVSKTIPVRLSIAQIRHLRTLVEKSAVDGAYWGPPGDWYRRNTWLHRTLLDAEYRLRNRGKTRPEDMRPPDDDEALLRADVLAADWLPDS